MIETTPLTTTPLPVSPTRALTAAEFRGLAEVPPELEWFANLTERHETEIYTP